MYEVILYPTLNTQFGSPDSSLSLLKVNTEHVLAWILAIFCQ